MASGAKIIQIDLVALNGLAGRLTTARSSLVSGTGAFNDSANGIEHPVLRSSITSFEANWSERRREIEEALTASADAIRKVASSFEAVERALIEQLEGAGEKVS